MPTGDGWRFVNDVLGGPGRNRTADTRIFNLTSMNTIVMIFSKIKFATEATFPVHLAEDTTFALGGSLPS